MVAMLNGPFGRRVQRLVEVELPHDHARAQTQQKKIAVSLEQLSKHKLAILLSVQVSQFSIIVSCLLRKHFL